jgi:immune inhibitor A
MYPQRLTSLSLLAALAMAVALVVSVASIRDPSVATAAPVPRPRGTALPETSPAAGIVAGISYAEPGEELLEALARQMDPANGLDLTNGPLDIRDTAATSSGDFGPAAGPSGESRTRALYQAQVVALLESWNSTHFHGPDTDTLSSLLENEQRALEAGSSPKALGLSVSGKMRLLVIAVEFAGSDTVEDFSHPISVHDRECVVESLTLEGPLHGRIARPGPRDNNTLWLPNFEADYYQSIVFGTEGLRQRVRPDLTDPDDGRPGIDISGQTVEAFYNEASGGALSFDPGPAGVVAWIQVPHSEAYYGASHCSGDIAPDVAAMQGLPSNPMYGFGPRQLLIDIVDVINAERPDFPWSDYDSDGNGVLDHVIVFHAGKDKSNGGGEQTWQAIWAHRGSVEKVVDDGGTSDDPSDDIRLLGYTMQYEDAEPGVIAHEFGHDLGLPDLYDTSRGGANSSEYWDVMGAGGRAGKLNSTHPVQLSTWTKFALGWSDPLVVTPTGEAQEVRIGQVSGPPPGSRDAVRVNLPPTERRIVSLPHGSHQAWWSNADQNWADVRLARDLDLADVTSPITLSFDLRLDVEPHWDYMFVEVSADGGQTFTQTKGYQLGTDTEMTTPDDYTDPNCRLAPHPERPECPEGNYGGLTHGYTGVTSSGPGYSDGWTRVYHDLTAFAGQVVTLRFRYATDAGSLEQGAYVDNISVTTDDGELFRDDVENDDRSAWRTDVRSFYDSPLGRGWEMSRGVEYVPRYYLLEWRNDEGFDSGLRHLYNTVLSHLYADGRSERLVDYLSANVPGMVVWYRDLRFGWDPFGTNNNTLTEPLLLSAPSEGAKGGLLVVDANPQPLRGPLGGRLSPVDPESGARYGPFAFPPLDNWRGRIQTTNASFNLSGTAGFTLTVARHEDEPTETVYTRTYYAPLPAVRAFHDALGYYPGVEELPEPIKVLSTTNTLRLKPYALADPDASVVVPARGYYPPRTPAGFTGEGAESQPPSDTVSTFETIYDFAKEHRVLSVGQAGGLDVRGQHSGNPGSQDLQFGHHFEVIDQAVDGSYGVVRLWNSMHELEVGGAAALEATDDLASTKSGAATYLAHVESSTRNVGSPTPLVLVSDFDETAAAYVAGSATDGALPVEADIETLRAVLASGDREALQALVEDGPKATAVVWASAGDIDTGQRRSFSYWLSPGPSPKLNIVTTAAGRNVERAHELSLSLPQTAAIFVPSAATGRR